MSALVIIPARLGSTRFPAKMLASDTGRPLVQHVVDRVRACRRVSRIVVATDHERIVSVLRPFGTEVVLTSPDHPSGTDRVAEVARSAPESIIVNVQGDEPDIEPEVVDALVQHLQQSQDDMATAATPFKPGMDPADPNLVKVVRGLSGYAMYFSRSVIPYDRDRSGQAAYWLHLGIYAYRREFLLRYATWAPTGLEQTERLEQLRALEHGVRLYVLPVDRSVGGIDTPEQYAAFVRRYRERSAGAERTGAESTGSGITGSGSSGGDTGGQGKSLAAISDVRVPA